jgi:hypothetical protein
MLVLTGKAMLTECRVAGGAAVTGLPARRAIR